MTKSSDLVLSVKQQTITNSYYPQPLAQQPQFRIPFLRYATIIRYAFET